MAVLTFMQSGNTTPKGFDLPGTAMQFLYSGRKLPIHVAFLKKTIERRIEEFIFRTLPIQPRLLQIACHLRAPISFPALPVLYSA